MRRVNVCACVLLSCASVVSSALADGGFFALEGQATDLSQTRQEVLMAFYGGSDDAPAKTTYVIQTSYSGDPADLAWVIPLPATPTDVKAHEDGSLFTGLAAFTKPVFTLVFSSGGGGCGCGVASNGTQTGLVDVEAQGQAGIYEWAALTSTGSQALLTWLNDNSFAVPASAGDVLDGYIQKAMHFLAIRVNQPASLQQNADGDIGIPPIQFTCQTAERFYPMAISQISAAAQTEVLVYILADHRAEAVNVANATISATQVKYDAASSSLTNYESLFTQAIAANNGLALVTEYAGTSPPIQVEPSVATSWGTQAISWPDAPAEALQLDYLTRMRTLIAPEKMTVDFTFADADTDDAVSQFFTVSGERSAQAAAAGQSMLALALFTGCCTVIRRRHRAP